MKTESQIKRKLKQVSFRHRQKYVQKGLAVKPCNCKYNGSLEFKTPDKLHQIRICTYSDDQVDWNNRVCDEGLGGLKQAQGCPFYECRNTPESLKKEFDASIGLDGTKVQSKDIARKYPDIMALYWVLGPPEAVEESDSPPQQSPDNSEYLLFMSEFIPEE